MDFLIITGLSGAGKSRAINALEDIGFYCVDNMPPSLISKFAELCRQSQDRHTKVAIVTDARGGNLFSDIFYSLDELRQLGFQFKILFLECSEDALVRRYKETRRKHPLSEDETLGLEECINKEREILKPVRNIADYLIDTTYLSPAKLKEHIVKLFLGDVSSALLIQCMSFGFKYGSPQEADLVFDVRCLPNPFYIEELKMLTGLDQEVRDYVLKWPQTQGLIPKLFDMIDYLIPLYCNEGKSTLCIAIGCTGGKHRSVTLTERLYQHLTSSDKRASVHHRDINKL